jgi:hypothetical protein
VRDLRRRLIVPAFVAVTSFVPACGDDTPPSTDTGSTTDSTTGTSSSTGETPTSTGDTDTGDVTGGVVPDCGMVADEPTCKSTVGCLWDDLGGICVNDCSMIDDAAECAMAAYCEWYDGACYPPI